LVEDEEKDEVEIDGETEAKLEQ
jgi:hypothetical protein